MVTKRKNNQTERIEKLRLSGMDCADCALSIEKSLRSMQGVSSASVSFGASSADVQYDPSLVTHEALVNRVKGMGYHVEQSPQTGSIELMIEGMDCGDCARTVEKAVAALPGVESVSVNFVSARLSVVPGQGAASGLAESIEQRVREAGYSASRVEGRNRVVEVPFWRRERRVLTTAVGALLALVAFTLSFFPVPSWAVNALFGLTVAVSGYGFARAGLLAARSGRADMNLLMTVAAIGAAALGDWAEAATVVLLFAFGGTLQAYTLEKTRGAIRALMDLSPNTALVRRADGREVRLPVEDVRPGEMVLVGPGERLPLDGVITEGTSSVDQAPITGESVPVDVEPDSEVYAGTINGPGAFMMRSVKAANDTTLARIIQMVEEAQARRAPSQMLVDRFSAIYTPIVIVGALLVAVVPPLLLAQPFGDWLYRALVLLVVSCPCALVISTPVSIVAAIGAATRRGVLIKGGATLEALGKVRTVAFDKTGTLTEGRPQVVSVTPLHGAGPDDLLKLAASVEARSEHPLARAIVHAARELRPGATALAEARGFKAMPGLGARADVDGRTVYVGNARLFVERGVHLDGAAPRLDASQAEGSTAVLVGTERDILGIISLADRPRADARRAIEKLRQAGVSHIAMLTGDNQRTAEAIAQQVGVDECHAELLPAEKVEVVGRIRDKHGAVAMVGDGVNDAPALALADVGIAMGVTGTDAALEVADVALMSDDLLRLDYAVLLSRKTLGVIKANIALSLATKALALVLATLGMLPLWGAIAADMGTSLLVTLNGMRLLAYRDE
jgi:Cd2+/Zn2+-exporting ATPase